MSLFHCNVPCLILSARGQQIGQLQQQLQQLKQQHEATAHDLEQRIAAVEQRIEKRERGQGITG
jgi:uncharacterized Zn finger protein